MAKAKKVSRYIAKYYNILKYRLRSVSEIQYDIILLETSAVFSAAGLLLPISRY